MMRARELDASPATLPLYARALAPLLPGASHLPFLAGGGGELPELQLTVPRVGVDSGRLVGYEEVCAFGTSRLLPATYPHVLAFPLQLSLITGSGFPFRAVGLIHVANRITQHRRVDREERLDLSVRAAAMEEHPRGRVFSLITQARVQGELVWEESSTMLHREDPAGAAGAPAPAAGELLGSCAGGAGALWILPADLGRRYAAVSGDRNPIHLSALTARLFGFPCAIAHGMWTMARALAALEGCLPEAFTVDVSFRAPILLPATVEFTHELADDAIRFSVRGQNGERRHLDGAVQPNATAAHQVQEES
jgi:acyl dehydratase